jgi:hypothetical protein
MDPYTLAAAQALVSRPNAVRVHEDAPRLRVDTFVRDIEGE